MNLFRNIKKNFFSIIVGGIMMQSCTSSTSEQEKETVVSGRITVLVDETFEPIVEDQLRVFENTYDRAKIDLLIAPENRVFHLLMSDSAKVAVVSRVLTEKENDFFVSKSIIPKMKKFATDAVALITHQSNVVTEISVEEITQILRGSAQQSRSLVFDNPNSSTVRYLKDLAGVDSLPKEGVYALRSNADVIEHVFNNKNAIGVVGVNWLAQPSVEQELFVKEIVALKVKGKVADKMGYKPTQSNLAEGFYPLARDLYIINCQGTYGLGLGFSAFLAGERGQRIILKSGLLPDSIPSRELIIR